jgi:hypothetical protein
MADAPSTARACAWETAFHNYTTLNHRLEEAPAQERDHIECQIVALQNDLLDTPAPSIMAVRHKLEILWECELHGLDQNSEERRLILEDLEGLIRVQRDLLGA